MRRTLQVFVLAGVIGLSCAGIAAAAGSPSIATGAATKISDTTAVLNGTVNPNGHATLYDFSYGPTTAYGATSALHKVKSGTRAVAITTTITGLTPGTTYHYRLSATNAGGAVNVGKTVATPTGVINPEGATTTWVIQYGLTTAYGLENFPGTLAAVTTPVSVSAVLTGLSPATLFHYRLVAFHGSTVVSDGGDATFFTEPSKRPVPKMTAHTSPGRDKRSPFAFTTSGSLSGASSIPALQRCTGNVGVRFFNGRRQLAFVVAPVQPDCKFSVSASFRRLHSRGPAKLKVTVDYRGNGYIAAVTRTDHVTAG
jgi:phosphodiesterase/alkaline phosphatase D-like protein